jgi:agmatinase
MLRQLTGINIVGADVVEVAPAYDHAEITCVAAATVVFDLLSLIVANNSPSDVSQTKPPPVGETYDAELK